MEIDINISTRFISDQKNSIGPLELFVHMYKSKKDQSENAKEINNKTLLTREYLLLKKINIPSNKKTNAVGI
ncbi:MAG: hypothetical protein QMD77_02645 [Patescibacteria group bacterium]|nr:hypothetical protein [Patescibacteria group bacterium]